MKTELKAKFIQHILGKKKENEGFTLIELLVVIIIIGILSAIALPSFLNQAAKAKQSEAKTYIGSVNRAQQSYRIENTQFATDIAKLEIGIPTSTPSYEYEVTVGGVSTAEFEAKALDAKSLKSFSGGVVILDSGQTSAVACQTTGVSDAPPGLTLTGGADASCADGEIMK
ncbi:prepilin-type N-terminal cleavage/methylation domain-containing protein [Anabaena sp. UHCC 0253]|uniref:type IV pilin-like G/H family protein n=1 Tax=Anabaena sp. UHCC 0253 TaxID=2590019 RepID=UPI00144816D4|nr:type IV pilin-like G/H family protein [Anabaena sp. UHCC 0253]MTJ52445.1 prepilin-type N-terminal cleavage/methylation domain-containing protein [Anabaena sp. UHCC 0253]